MGEIRDIAEPEGARAALDRMGSTKNNVDGLHVRLAAGEGQQAGLHGIKSLEGLFKVDLMKLADIDRHKSLRRLLKAPGDKSWS